jgi:hypothetical protein
MRTILATVGTSLLGNARRDLPAEQPNAQQLANYLRHTDVIRVSAETNSLSRLPGKYSTRLIVTVWHNRQRSLSCSQHKPGELITLPLPVRNGCSRAPSRSPCCVSCA